MTASAVPLATANDRLLAAIDIYSVAVVNLLNFAILFFGSVKDRAIFLDGWNSTLGGANQTYFQKPYFQKPRPCGLPTAT